MEARNLAGAKVGQRVRLEQTPAAHVRNACILFVVPSICALVGAVAGHEWLAAWLGWDAVIGGAATGLVAAGIGLLPARFFSLREESLPRLTAIIGEENGGNP